MDNCILDHDEIYITINKFLCIKDVIALGTINRHSFILSNSNAIWERLYEKLMKDKLIDFHSSFLYKVSSPTISIRYKYRYFIAQWDIKREFLTIDDLIEHAFSFRFKQAAGEQWMLSDPWWQGKSPMSVKFNIDGTLSLSNKLSRISNADADNNNNDDENEDDDVAYTLSSRLRYELAWKRGNKDRKKQVLQEYLNISKFLDDDVIEGNDVLSLCKLKSISSPASSSCVSILSANTGNILRIYVNDVVVPSYYVWRTESAGFIIESCWAVYSSFKLPLKGEYNSLEFIWTNETDIYRSISSFPCPYPYPLI